MTERIEVAFPGSTSVTRAVFDVATGIVEVTFRGLTRYRYAKFTREKFDAWAAAKSAGKWLAEHVKRKPWDHPVIDRAAWPVDDREAWEPRAAPAYPVEHFASEAAYDAEYAASARVVDVAPLRSVAELLPFLSAPAPISPPVTVTLLPGLTLQAAPPSDPRVWTLPVQVNTPEDEATAVAFLAKLDAQRVAPKPVRQRDVKPENVGRLLSEQDLEELPQGTPIEVIWSGGNGPYEYKLFESGGWFYALVDGEDPRTEPASYLSRAIRPGTHKSQEWVRLPCDKSWPSACRRCGEATYGGCCPTGGPGGPSGDDAGSEPRATPGPATRGAVTDVNAARAAQDVSAIATRAAGRGNEFVVASSPTPDTPSEAELDAEAERFLQQFLAEGGDPSTLLDVRDLDPSDPRLSEAQRTAQMEQLLGQEFTDPTNALLSGDVSTLAELLRQADAEACRRDFGEFYRTFWREIEPSGRDFVPNPGTDALIVHAQAVGDGVITKLGIACPPGFGKTSCWSVAFPAWMWARNPSWRVICASHAFELARDIAQKFHRLITSDRYRAMFPEVVLASDALKALTTTAGGVRYAVGVGGALTGLRANAGIIDDSLNAIDANRRQAVLDVNAWYDQAFSTRFDDREDMPPRIVSIQQRLAENDLIAHVRTHGVEILELPARFESARRCVTSVWKDPRTREGEILAPKIHSEAFLEEKLRVLRPHGFAGQYQQAPSPRAGNQFKIDMWNWCAIGGDGTPRSRPKGARNTHAYVVERLGNGSLDLDWLCVSMDPTGGSVDDDASGLGLAIIGGKGQRRFVFRDLSPGPRGFNAQVDDLKSAIVTAGEVAGKQRVFQILIEKKALGVGSAEKIEQALHDGKLTYPDGTPIVATVKYYEPSGKGDKELRADHIEPDVAAGLVHLLDGQDFGEWIQEFALFPRGTRDDRVDVLSQAMDDHRAPVTTSQWTEAVNKLAAMLR